MDGIANVARQQQSQMNTSESQGRVAQEVAQQVQAPRQENVIKEIQKENSGTDTKINSREQVEELVKQLNNAMAPMSKIGRAS